MDQEPDRKRRLTPQELAFHYGVSLDSIRAKTSGRRPGRDLPEFEKDGGRVYFSAEAIERWQDSIEARPSRGHRGKKH